MLPSDSDDIGGLGFQGVGASRGAAGFGQSGSLGVGGGGGDRLSLDLQFATDKTLTARKGPTPTFTRASTATFVGSDGLIQSAAINQARFDHDPVTLACKGLLIEESRTNLTIRSDDFGAAEWNSAGARNLTVTTNNTTSPSGAADADLLTVGATTTVYQVVQALPAAGNVTSGTTYTISVFLKPNQVTRASVWVGNIVTLPADAIFDLTGSGSVVLTTAGTASIQKYPNGWYRCIITGTAGATSNTTLRIGPASGVSRTYIGNSVDSFWAWGAQLEAGAFPTSYIPTVAASVVRSADVCSITGANFSGSNFYNQSEGTLFADVIGLMDTAISGGRQFVVFSDNTYANTMGISKASGTAFLQASARTSNVSQFIFSNAYVPFTRYKVALGIKANDTNAAFNGSLGTTVTSVTMPSTISELELRDPTGANGGQPTCHIAAIRYYKKRLPNAKLQTLTT